eukprot:3261386-Pyramimonas_sp.AAC.1
MPYVRHQKKLIPKRLQGDVFSQTPTAWVDWYPLGPENSEGPVDEEERKRTMNKHETVPITSRGNARTYDTL